MTRSCGIGSLRSSRSQSWSLAAKWLPPAGITIMSPTWRSCRSRATRIISSFWPTHGAIQTPRPYEKPGKCRIASCSLPIVDARGEADRKRWVSDTARSQNTETTQNRARDIMPVDSAWNRCRQPAPVDRIADACMQRRETPSQSRSFPTCNEIRVTDAGTLERFNTRVLWPVGGVMLNRPESPFR